MGSCDVPSISVRVPLAIRVYIAVFAGGFIVFVIVTLINAIRHHAAVGAAPIAVAMAAFAGCLAYRLAGMAVYSAGQELVIRNFYRTWHVFARDIHGFDLGKESMGKNRTIRVLTSREAIPIDMLGAVLSFDIMRATRPLFSRREYRERIDRERLDPYLRALTDWRDASKIDAR